MRCDTALIWFRRDLRVADNAALYHALKCSRRVYCVFVFDRAILDALPSRTDRRVEFIHASLLELDAALRRHGGALIVQHGHAVKDIPAMAHALKVDAVFANHDYEPAATARDADVARQLKVHGIAFHTVKDQVLFEKDEILTGNGTFYSVFTPYKNAVLKKLDAFYLQAYPVEKYLGALAPGQATASGATRATRATAAVPAGHAPSAIAIPSLEQLGFARTNLAHLGIAAGETGAQKLFRDFKQRMAGYEERRNFPAVKGPSYLSVHLRFGTISIRSLAREAWKAWHGAADFAGGRGAEVWLAELIWRDFYFHILHHNPHVVERAFKPQWDAIRWDTGAQADQHFAAWCEGRTGYPLVDAAMRQLNQTGYMHNRLRMVTASFLTKDLGIDWRRGERYFAGQLIDFDLSANNGGWQWAASTGCDAQPWFRIFNPVMQSEKFDAEGKFIRRYVPVLAALSNKAIHAPWLAKGDALKRANVLLGEHYPLPIVDHAAARANTLARFGAVTGRTTRAP